MRDMIEEDFFQDVLEQASDGVIIIDGSNAVTFMNAAAERLWRISRSRVIGQNVKMLVPGAIRGQHDAMVDRNRKTGEDRIVGRSRDVEIEHADGSSTWVNLKLVRVVRRSGETTYTAFVRDTGRERAAMDAAVAASGAFGTAVGRIVGSGELISALAEKTNLLAINASIEASRAGASGRAFSIIAHEMKRLADSITVAAKDIGRIAESCRANSEDVERQLRDARC